MFPPHRRGGVVECSPGSGGGIPITPRNGAERTVWKPRCHQSPSPRPGGRLSVRPGASPVARFDLVDAHHERLPGPGPANLDRAVERMTGSFGTFRLDIGIPEPAGVGNAEGDGLARVDRHERLVVAGEPAP